MGVYQYMIDSHNDFCGCNYCILLKEYVNYKIRHHKEKKLVELQEMDYYYDGRSLIHIYYTVDKLKNKYEFFKKLKNDIKRECKLQFLIMP